MHQPTLPFFQIYPKWMHHIYLRYYKDDILYWIYYCSDYYLFPISQKNIVAKNYYWLVSFEGDELNIQFLFYLLCSEFSYKLLLVVLNLFPVKIEHWKLWILSNQQKCWKLCEAILEYQMWTVFALYTTF